MKRLEDQPFVLLGINSDDDPDEYRAKRKEYGVTWPSLFEGSTSGPIPTKWGVQGWPTIYVLDHEGRIRYEGVRGEDMDRAVDTLLAEMGVEAPPPSHDEPEDAGGEGGTVPATPLVPPAKNASGGR